MSAKHLLLLCLAGFFSACAAPGGGSVGFGAKVSTSRDEYGHRPGARGFSTVILDAGHGGEDSGAKSPFTGDFEKNLTVNMVKLVRDELAGSVKVILTRDHDMTYDLDKRVEFVNGHEDAVLVSIHFNSTGSSAIAGPEVYYWRVDSYTLGKRIEQSLSAAVPYHSGNRGLVRRRLRLTRNPWLPSVLVECGYLSNAPEAASIAKPAYQRTLAKAIAKAILAQRAEGDGNLGPLPPPINAPLSRPTDPRE
jgi:N-acetylmuramoyl-L-alanine amidase